MDQEIIVLKLVWELIDEMVNYEMFAQPASIEDTVLTCNCPDV